MMKVLPSDLFLPVVRRTVVILLLAVLVFPGMGQTDSLSTEELKKLSLEQLMNVTVTTVSRRPEKIGSTSSAVQVITSEDLRRSGVKTLSEALKLAINLQVAQVNASQWAISARGFNNVLANKLLVMIDGRTVYTPLYAGVFWDIQNYVLADIERIEVISGPGGTLWGSNAVNGVINIITRNSADSRGFFAEVASGINMPWLASVRYGNNITKDLSFRAYFTGFKMGNTVLLNDSSANDQWGMLQGGVRLDWKDALKNQVSVQANVYGADPNSDGATAVEASGDNAILRWSHNLSASSNIRLQYYYDHTWRDFGNDFTEDLKTHDLDYQHGWSVAKRNILTYGAGVRIMDHLVTNRPLFGFFPGERQLYLYSGFIHNEYSIIEEKLHFTLGLKAEHNSYTGMQYQPNARLSLKPGGRSTIWAAVSRAVRNPSRIDRDFAVYLAPGVPLIMGSDSFMSETALSYELGARSQYFEWLNISVSAFYNVYDKLRSAEPGPPPLNLPITIGNGVAGNTYGAEIFFSSFPVRKLHVRGGYTFLTKQLRLKPGSMDLNNATSESNDPVHQFLIQPAVELPWNLECGMVIRYNGVLPDPYVADYTMLDLRLAWRPSKFLEVSITGQNLLYESNLQFIPSSPAPRKIPRELFGRLTVRF